MRLSLSSCPTPDHLLRCLLCPSYRLFPSLQDGQAIKPSERIAAVQVLPQLEAQLRGELRAEGIDPDQAAFVEDDSDMLDENGEIRETGHVDDKGEMRRPWCAATRILEHRESVGGGRRGGGGGGSGGCVVAVVE